MATSVSIPLKGFLITSDCPPAWLGLDLYIFRDDEVVFYVGQSQLAYARVWEHLLSGFKGHSIVGRFVWSNWPGAMNFTIELLSSQAVRFAALGYDLDAAEQLLIRQYAPCFNVTHNCAPTPLPPGYRLPKEGMRRRRSLRALIHEAERAVQREENRRW